MNRSNTMSMSRGLVAAWMLGLAVPLAAMDPAPAADLGEQLREAARVGNEELVQQLLLDQGADINAADRWGNTPLHRASYFDRVGVVRLLLQRGANVNAVTRSGLTPLHNASEHGHVGVVELLLDQGADVNAADNLGLTPLYLASFWGCTGVVDLLLLRGADVNAASSNGWTPLQIALTAGHEGVVQLLLQQPVNVADRIRFRLASGYSLAKRMLRDGHRAVVQFLHQHDAVMDQQVPQPIGAQQDQQQPDAQDGLIETLRTYNQYLDHASLSSQDACPICKEDWSNNALLALPCGHLFDQACIEPWLEQRETCPMCRRAVTVEQLRAKIARLQAAPMQEAWDEGYGFDYQASDCNIM